MLAVKTCVILFGCCKRTHELIFCQCLSHSSVVMSLFVSSQRCVHCVRLGIQCVNIVCSWTFNVWTLCLVQTLNVFIFVCLHMLACGAQAAFSRGKTSVQSTPVTHDLKSVVDLKCGKVYIGCLVGLSVGPVKVSLQSLVTPFHSHLTHSLTHSLNNFFSYWLKSGGQRKPDMSSRNWKHSKAKDGP